MASPETLYLVDGTAQLYRAYFALGGLTSPDGVPTNAVYGFTTMLRKLIREERPALLAVAFDAPGKVFRHDAFAEYKANRPPSPDDLKVQVPYAKQVCEVFGVPVLELKGYEADDLIATYVRIGRRAGHEVVVVAADKDLLQLVTEGVSVLDPVKDRRLDAERVLEHFGVEPARVIDVLGLMGDAVDNIPGVPGVGQKTALSVVGTYGDTERVIDRAQRFVASYDGRDALVTAIDEAATAPELSEAAVAAVREAADGLSAALDRLLEIEKDPDGVERLNAVRDLLAGGAIEAFEAARGQPGRKAAKILAPLKRALKGLDRGSSKRAWYAIAGNADRARASRQLATLDDDVPVSGDLQAMHMSDLDRPAAETLFRALGFRKLLDELAGAGGAAARPAVAQGVEVDLVRDAEGLRCLAEELAGAAEVAIRVVGDGAEPQERGPVGVALAWRAGHAAYIAVGHDYLGAPEQVTLEQVAEALRTVLGRTEPGVVGHDLKSDIHALARAGIEVGRWRLDTMLAAFLLNPGRSDYRLDELAGEFLGRTVKRLEELTGSGARRRPLAELEPEQVAAHAGEQAEVALSLAPILEDRLEQSGLSGLYATIDGPLLPLLARMERRGVRVDVDLLVEMSATMEAELESCRKAIHDLAGESFNIDSPKQVREVLFDRLGLKSRRKTAKSRAASTDAQTLEELSDQHPIAGKLLEYREQSKLKSTYVDSLPRLVDPSTGRVHTSYSPVGAATGRLSSSNPNLQNIPVRSEAGRRIRKAFVPEEGWVFLASDYSQIELRVLAHMCGDPGLTSAFRDGEDIHRHTASKIFGVLPDLVSDGMRRRAKAINFGLLYGMSEFRLAREQGISRSEARQFIETYFSRFARVRDYIEGTREQARRDAAVRTLFGRIRLFPQLHQRTNRAVEEQALRAAVNTTIQGTAADLMKLAMLATERSLNEAGSEARVLLQVHDELLLELPPGELEAVRGLVRQAMEGVHPLSVPLVVDQKSGNSWFDVT